MIFLNGLFLMLLAGNLKHWGVLPHDITYWQSVLVLLLCPRFNFNASVANKALNDAKKGKQISLLPLFGKN